MNDVLTIVVDGLGSLQTKEYFTNRQSSSKAEFAEWADYGASLYNTYSLTKKLTVKHGIEVVPVQILGKEGTGKTVGIMKLDPKHTIILNCEEKDLTWFGWKKDYGPHNKNYFVLSNYAAVDASIDQIVGAKKANYKVVVVFFLGHIEEYTDESGGKSARLKMLGKQGTKQNIEGMLSWCFYTHIDIGKKPEDPERYKLSTVTSGKNTARTPLGAFDSAIIPNNYKLILEKIASQVIGE